MKRISQSAELFFKYSFSPNEKKYYTTERGSRHYRNSSFKSFLNSNNDCFDITGSGNDAPRGGATGDYIIAKPNEKFYIKWQWWFDQQEAIKKAKEESEQKRQSDIAALGDQAENLRKYFKDRPGKAREWEEKTENMGSSKWRNWLRMKAASKVADNRFDLLTLSAPEIKKIMQDFV